MESASANGKHLSHKPSMRAKAFLPNEPISDHFPSANSLIREILMTAAIPAKRTHFPKRILAVRNYIYAAHPSRRSQGILNTGDRYLQRLILAFRSFFA